MGKGNKAKVEIVIDSCTQCPNYHKSTRISKAKNCIATDNHCRFFGFKTLSTSFTKYANPSEDVKIPKSCPLIFNEIKS